ncbi:MAG: DUF885 family protein [Rhizomicrobium sp.]
MNIDQPPSATTDRRQFLAATGAAMLLPPIAHAASGADAKFYALLDTLKETTPDETVAGAATARARQVAGLAALRGLDPGLLSFDARLDYDGILEGLGLEAILRSRFPFGTVGQTISPHVVSPRVGTYLTVKDGPPEILARTAANIDGETERLNADAAAGIVPPDFILAATLAKLADTRVTAGPISAALDRQAAALKALRAQATPEAGVWRLKDGDAYYALALKAGTSLSIDPEAAHQAGLDLVAHLSAEADAAFRRLGMTDGTVVARFAALIDRAVGRYDDSDAGRAKAVADMTATLARARAAIAPCFDEIPKSAIAIGLAPPGRIGYRVAPSYDGSRPGAYYVDLADPVQGIRYRPAWTLPTVVHHETLPGHLLQLPLQEKAKPHPLRLRYTPNAFFEGWGIYAERLASEIGLLDGDFVQLGVLQSLLVRAARLVVDTGLHHKRWTRAEAIAKFRAIALFALNPVDSEVDRIVVEPGAASGPALGYTTILNLRGGTALPRFHTALLKRGPLRLSLLARAVAA